MTETPNILKYQTFETNKLIEYIRNPRNNDAVVDKMVDCIKEYGFRIPIVAKSDGGVVDGHLRLKAARKLGLKEVPVVLADDLTEAQIKAFRLVANQSANWAEWDKDLLRLELLDLKGMDFDLNLTGFDLSEVDRLIQENKTIQEDEFEEDIEEKEVITKPGDIWILGNHRLMCGDAEDEVAINRLMSDQIAGMVFTHFREEAVTEQLPQIFKNLKNKTKDGSLFFIGTDWQRMYEIMSAGRSIFDEYKQLCVWNKGIEQQAELYKNQLELFFVFKKGEAKHTNNFGLGETGRYRTNVWSYRADEVPVQLAADAILDCSHINEIILDPFGGKGTTLIASEETGRRCYMMEIDPKYCDTIIRRYQQHTGNQAILESTNKTFEEIAAERNDK